MTGMLSQHWEVLCFHHTDMMGVQKMRTGTVLAKDTRMYLAASFFPVRSIRISGIYSQREVREEVSPVFFRASLKPLRRSAAHLSKFRRGKGID